MDKMKNIWNWRRLKFILSLLFIYLQAAYIWFVLLWCRMVFINPKWIDTALHLSSTLECALWFSVMLLCQYQNNSEGSRPEKSLLMFSKKTETWNDFQKYVFFAIPRRSECFLVFKMKLLNHTLFISLFVRYILYSRNHQISKVFNRL